MPTITLDQLREDIEKKYAPVTIDLGDNTSVTLTQILRLGKEKRKQLADAEKEREKLTAANDEFDEDATLEYMRNVLRIVATDADEADYLCASVGDDLVMLSEVLNAWREGTQAGEAQSSPS